MDWLRLLWRVDDNSVSLGSLFLFAFIMVNYIWRFRNEVDHNGERFNPTTYNQILKKFTNISTSITLPRHVISTSWSPPSTRQVKLNFDASVGSSSKVLPAVACDENGKVLVLKYEFIQVHDYLVFEAKDLLMAIRLDVSMSWSYVFFESDAMLVTNCFNQSIVSISWWI